jgi:uncharacterized protein (UPF0333 family)
MGKKAQVSTEYLMLFSFIMGIVLVLFVLFQSYTQETQDKIRLAQADQVTKKIVNAAEKVFYLGEPSKITIKVSIPENIEAVNIGNNEVFFIIKTGEGSNEIGQVSPINITGTIPAKPGNYEINIESKGDYVLVSI